MSNNDLIIAKKQAGKGKSFRTIKGQRLTFYILMFLPVLIQFSIFYIYLNFNSILLAFEEYTVNINGLGHIVKFAGFENFKIAFDFFASKQSGKMILNSLILYLVNLVIVTTLAIFFSYYMAKKYPFSGTFRVILYLPTIVSGAVMGILYKYIVTDVYSGLVLQATGSAALGLLDQSAKSEYFTILFFNVWTAFGGNVMIYTSTMSSIDESVIESARLEGVNTMQELFYIYIPLIYPTLTTFIVTGMTAIFTNQMSLYTFYGQNGSNFSTDVFGYYFYRLVKSSSVDLYKKVTPMSSYPELSALGLIITFILAPITLLTRYLMVKLGPSVE